MAVSNQHPEFEKWAGQAQRNRLVFEGEEALKCHNTYGLANTEQAIIRRLSGQTPWEFEAYQHRAVLYPFAKRVRQALNGAIFRKVPTINVPEGLNDLLEEATPYGTSFVQMMCSAADEIVSVGRYGVLVDLNSDGTPVMLPYLGEKIINWRKGIVNGKQDLNLLVLEECVTVVDPKDEFQEIEIVQYRVCRMAELESGVSVYVQEVWQDDKVIEQKVPLAAGKPLGYIPFVFFNTSDTQPTPQYSILYDLVTLNLHHYRWTAEEGNALHFIALPTAWVSGTKPAGNAAVQPFVEVPVPAQLPATDPGYEANEAKRNRIIQENAVRRKQTEEKAIHMGPGHILNLGPQGAQAGVLEHTGKGIESVQNKMNTLVNQMASIGARLFSEHPEDETATAVKIQKTSESNALMHLCNVLDEGFRDLLTYAADWVGANDGAINVAVNREFIAETLTADEATKLYNLFEAAGIDVDALVALYAKGGMYAADADLEAEKKRLLDARAEKEARAAEIANQAQANLAEKPAAPEEE